MEPLNFIYWLQGYLELQDPKTIDGPKVQMIKDHLALVLKKETPVRSQNTYIDWTKESKLLLEEERKRATDRALCEYHLDPIPASC